MNLILVCSENGSDKEYRVQLEQEGDGYVVNFQYGRRGQALKSGTKTSKPLEHATAKKVFDKLVAEKLAKGYVDTGEASSGFTKAIVNRPAGNFLPQLCNAIPEDQLSFYLNSDEWGMQEKMDGERRSIQMSQGGGVVGLNRRGLVVDLPEGVASSVAWLYRHLAPCVLDGEIIGDKFYVFDIFPYESEAFEVPVVLPLSERYQRLSNIDIIFQNVVLVELATFRNGKKNLLDRVRFNNGEGVVFKKLDSLYHPGRPNSGGDWLKFKFVESASCLVIGTNAQRSVKIGLYDTGDRHDVIQGVAVVSIGNVTIPPNHDIPQSGDVVEVRYLYAYKGGSLFQPVYLGKRTDVVEAACHTGQLKYYPGAASCQN